MKTTRALTTTYAQRRALLWRLDWRFLLPAPDKPFRRLLLLGGTSALAEQLQLLGTAQRVDNRLYGDAELEAAVVLYDAGISGRQVFEEIVARLKIGGVLYWEIQRLPRAPSASPPRVREALERHGLHITGLYAVSPHFREPRVFVPLRARGALRWYVDTLYEATSLRQAALERMLRVATGLQGDRFARLAPYYAVVGVVGHRAAGSVARGAAGYLWGAGVEPLLLTDGGNRVTLLPFKGSATAPLGVLKVPKRATFNARTINEQDALYAIRSRINGKLHHNMPVPLGTLQVGEITIGVESYLPGTSLRRSSGRWGATLRRQLHDLDLATDWLIDFHRAAPLQFLGWDESAMGRWVDELLDAFAACFGLTSDERNLFAHARQRARQLCGARLPLVYVHRDFNVWNLYRTERDLNVIDWEGARPGLPLCDLLHFVTHWHETARHLTRTEAQLQAFQELFVLGQGDRLAAAGRAAIHRYMQTLALDPGFYPLLLVCTWAELVVRRAEQQRDMGETLEEPRQGNRNFAFLAALASAADRLFAGDHGG